MPIYEYKCLNCGNQLEIMQRISDDALTECASCQGKLEKQWSLSGFQFKGSGWYVSDYGNRAGGDAAEGKAESNSEAKSETSATEGKTIGSDANESSKASEKNTVGSDSKAEVAKTPASKESTAADSAASQPAGKSSENKSVTKTD